MHGVDTIDSLVLDWLVREGHGSTFAKLPAATTTAAKQASENKLPARSEIVKSIKEGRILEALYLITLHFQASNNLENFPLPQSTRDLPPGPFNINQVTFLLKLQQFIEFLRGGQVEAALSWVKTDLMPASMNDSGLQVILQETLGVLAYENGEGSPMGWLFNRKLRYSWLASITNSALYRNPSSSSSNISPLEALIKHIHALDLLVHQINGFNNDIDDRKWASLTSILAISTTGAFIKTIKNE